ncbi:hypothetical protein [Streptomyces sp. NBC_00984]|uniref:hypothetical protein n=1 Tax=Streptomyces sp. NBC_00984 TaxID=2903700 RepID=UPI00386DA2AF
MIGSYTERFTVPVPPRIEEEEVEPYDIEEVQRLLSEAAKLRNSARRSIALALGLRQGEALGRRGRTSIPAAVSCASGRTV